MDFLHEYGLFLAQVVTVVVGIMSILSFMMSFSGRQQQAKGQLKVTDLSEKYAKTRHQIEVKLASKNQGKKLVKSFEKYLKRKEKEENSEKNRLFVLNFKGGIDAKEVAELREEITGVLSVACQGDEVLVSVESSGGAVHAYGLAAAQLQRLRDASLQLTISVDKVAASGGYMMACVGHKILAAPFSLIGSIGVVGQLPNFNKLLKQNHIDFEQHTAGEYKRTLTMFGENDEHGRGKFKQDLERIHNHFKQFVTANRPSLDIESVATGEYWLGTEAQALGLVDEITTTDAYLQPRFDQQQVVQVRYQEKKTLKDKLSGMQSQLKQSLFDVSRRFMS